MENIIITGFQDLDYFIKGFRDHELILLAGRPDMGKASFALNVARHATFMQSISSVFFSLEMSEEQIRKRIKDMKWQPKAELIIDDTPGITIEELSAKCRKLKAERQIGLILIDYLQLLSDEECNNICNGHSSRQLEMSGITQKLKKLAGELSVPIIIICEHPKMTDSRQNHRPILPDLRQIGAIEQDADIIIFLYRDESYNIDTQSKGIAEVIVAKHIRGNVGTVQLCFLPELCRFESIVSGDMEIEITGTDIGYTDIMQGIKCRCHQDFEKSILNRFLMRDYDLMDERFWDMNRYKIRSYTFGKEKNGVWRTTPVLIKTAKNGTEDLNILFRSKNYSSYEDVVYIIEKLLDESI